MAIWAVGCVPLVPYHTEARECAGDPKTECAAAYVEDHPEYLLGFVEFDDLGWAWNREQGRVLIEAIRREAAKGDVLMVVFAHGWKHNASSCDNNVSCFRQTLAALYETEQALSWNGGEPRRIIGIYIGWRGSSARGRVLAQTTFFGRKATAHKVGSGAVTELLVRLKEERQLRHDAVRNRQLAELEARLPPGEEIPDDVELEESSTRLVIVGHSFGGALVFSATSQLMMERLAVGNVRGGAIRGLGDLVILVNPAFEAARYQPLHASGTGPEQTYSSNQPPRMAILTSRGDGATRKAFPAGRWLPSKLDDYRRDEKGGEQRRANRIAVGHFEPYRTHLLDINANTPEPFSRLDVEECVCPFPLPEQGEMTAARAEEIRTRIAALRAQRLETGGTLLEFPTVTLRHDNHPEFMPLQVISVDPKIITGHNDIYQPAFIDFLRYYIMMNAAPTSGSG